MVFAFDGTSDCADGSDEETYILTLFTFHSCYKRIPNIFCDGFNNARMMFPCGDGESIPSPFYTCSNKRYRHAVKMLYDDNVTLCWQHLLCINYLDYLFPSLVNCTVLCGEYGDCSPRLSSVCHEKIVIFPPRPVIFSPPVYFAYETNQTEHVFVDFLCYSQCDHLYPPSFNFNGHSCRSTSEFKSEFINLRIPLREMIPQILYLFEKCRNNTETINSSLVFRCPVEDKVISSHRVKDGFPDCSSNFDELFDGNICMHNSTQRSQCWSNSSECIHRRFIQDMEPHCSDKSDEFYSTACLDGKKRACDYRRGLHEITQIQYDFQVTYIMLLLNRKNMFMSKNLMNNGTSCNLTSDHIMFSFTISYIL